MKNIIFLTLKTTIKDRIFLVILSMLLLFTSVPVFASFSMRQIQEIAITISITLNSFILLFLAMFGGVATIWRDIERKHTYTILSYPITRHSYFLGRFIGFIIIMLIITVLNFMVSCVMINIAASTYKSQLPIVWGSIGIAFFMTFLKYVLLMGYGFFFSAFSTSFFTPFFSTIAIYVAGNASQGVYDYIMKSSEHSETLKNIIKGVYYIFPNFSSFDFTAYATYALPINYQSVLMTIVYFSIYLMIIASFGIIVFSKRDMM
jgi:ABC-type transport system involved in multi-copper enzyme maturation permease subunit